MTNAWRTQWLGFFKAAMDGNRHCQEVLARYSRLIKYKTNQADLARLFRNEMVFFEEE
jgi:hypothetical protein